jgi:hypothetical protein
MKKTPRPAGRKTAAKRSSPKKATRKKGGTARRKPIMRHSREG